MARADFNQVAAVYDAGRELPPESMDEWRRAIARHLPERTALPAVDVGCGTGRFTSAIAAWFDVEVVGIDTAAEMLAVADSQKAHERVSYLLGRAEHLPLRDSACDFAWLSTVIHHFDLAAVVQELRRVLQPDGTVLVRSWFPGRADVTHFRYFPRAREIAQTFPALEATEHEFASAGFKRQALESVAQTSAPSLRAFCDRVRTRADSTLLALTDAEFAGGLRALEDDVAAETEPRPVISHLDLMVLR